MSLSILALIGALAGVTVAVVGDSDTNANAAAEIFRRSTGGQVEQAPSRAALRSPAPVTTQSLSPSPAPQTALPASISKPLDYRSVKPMTGKVSPAIFQTDVDSTNTNGRERRMALVDVAGGLGLLCRDIADPHRNYQLVQMSGERIVMRQEHPAGKGDHLTARCREAIAMMPLDS